MNIKGVIIQGSSRSKGNTNKIVTYIQKKTGFDTIDLKQNEINSFDYGFKNSNDDFLSIIEDIANNYDVVIFATPVYWFSMSGIMKNFFDRITDCLTVEKETGRKLRGKLMGLVSCGSDSVYKKEFEMPFVESAKYLGMHYLGNVHTWIENGEIPESLVNKLNTFINEKIKNGI